MKSADEMAERDLVSYASSSSTDGGYESSEKTSCIPKKFLNPLGFIDYGHYGELPWTTEDVLEEEIVFPPDYTLITDLLAIDCEMVGVGDYKISALGRVSIVNEYGYCVYDTFVNPREEVTDYRTEFSGIRADDLFNAPDVEIVLVKVSAIVHGKFLLGHSIHNDLEVLKLDNHPRNLIRDTATYFKNELRMKGFPSLKNLTLKYLGLEIQTGEHSSIQDAQATLKLYLLNRDSWEKDFAKRREDANLAVDYHCLTHTTPDTISDMHVEPREPDLFADSKTVFLRQNKVIGAYSSCGEYLDVQFRLLLEDFLRPLRDCVKNVNQWRQFKKNSLFHNVQIRIGENSEFEVKKLGKLLIPIERNNLEDVDWEETKMFLNGSLLLLTPDNLKTVKFAVIKFRLEPEKQKNSYFLTLHVEFSKHGPSWTVDKSNNRFLMMESTAFYEAYKHSLEYLQTVDLDKFPLKKYIVDAVTISQPPSYLLSPTNELDFSALMSSSAFSFCQKKAAPLDFHNWPNANQLSLDESQFEALQRALTQEMTIIQGPPGTGKTFIGVQIVKMLLSNPWLLNSPILIVSYTNHALDQTLEQILHFVTEKLCDGNEKHAHQMILRIGGGSKSEIIQPLVLRQKMDDYKEKKRRSKNSKSRIKTKNPVKEVEYSLSKNMSIRAAKVIGMTTTGAVKHKYIVHKTKPKIMIVEEAAHVLEAHVVASLTEHCQQMIMIGDHKQLRPLTADNNLATNYKLDISLMERLVKNGVDQGNRNWTQLKVQHRMRPEIARLVCPVIYEELHNHYDVHKYPDVKGCSKNLYFVDHRNEETKEKGSRSYCNLYEVNFLCDLVKHFVNGGFYKANQITVIATYLAQKVLIENKLKNLFSEVKVSTVDGFQGEENDVILLSLVRNNADNRVGFLKTDNRVCVALSRARHGLFMIGNISSLKAESETWSKINDILVEMGSIGSSLPLTSPGFTMKPPLPEPNLFVNSHSQDPFHQFNNRSHESYQPFLSSVQTLLSSVVTNLAKLTLSPCGHQKNIPGHQSHLGECSVLVEKKLTCGHLGDVACSEDVSDFKCDLMVRSILNCGHLQTYRCHLQCKVKCSAPVVKTLPCGHEQITACHLNPENVICKTLVPNDCSHEVLVNCEEAIDGTAVCGRKCDRIFNCGHRCPYLCHENDKSKHAEYQCRKLCKRKCPNGHRCLERHECYKFCHLTSRFSKCEKIVGHCSTHGEIECHRTKDGDFSCDADCDRIFKCGHRCRYLCHEDDNPNHLQYKCTERCERLCPNGHSCPGDHDCYLNCPVKAGTCQKCKRRRRKRYYR